MSNYLIYFSVFCMSLIPTFCKDAAPLDVYRYCIIGAGPSGLQLASFLQRENRNYIVFERKTIPGSFFELMPRHDYLLSSNKRFTGSRNTEFNLRHDWNSLLSKNGSLKFTKYSSQYFPRKQNMLKYLKDFYTYENINVLFNTSIERIWKNDNNGLFYMDGLNEKRYACKYLIVASGLEIPYDPFVKGSHLAYGYENMDLNPKEYRDKDVAIIGNGNAAFEIAKSIESEARSIVIFGKGPLRMAYSTHCVDDLRAVNFNILDSYQFSMLVGIVEIKEGISKLQKKEHKIFIPEARNKQTNREPFFDIVIRASGWRFNGTILEKLLSMDMNVSHRYPAINSHYMSNSMDNLYFIGTITHSLDYKESAGGFIQGFRYTVRALHRILEWKNEGNIWTNMWFPVKNLLHIMLKRINEGSGTYHMFLSIGDVYVFDRLMENFCVIEEYPLLDILNIEENTGVKINSRFIIMRFEYNIKYGGVGANTLSYTPDQIPINRADLSRLLHPVIYLYKEKIRKDAAFSLKYLPKECSIHHMVEDVKYKFYHLMKEVYSLIAYFQNELNLSLYERDDQFCLYHHLTAQGGFVLCKTYL